MRNLLMSLLLVVFLSVSPNFVIAQNGEECIAEAEKLSSAFRYAAAKVMPAVVFVEVTMESQNYWQSLNQGNGSGVIIDANQGYVLTANHVVENAIRVIVKLPDGRKFEATEFLNDPKTEIAVIKIPADNLPQAELGDSDRMQVGDWVLAIGSPLGELLVNSVSAGIISGKGRMTGILLDEQGYEDFIQTDAAINRGNSGGPLVNLRGQIIGINSNIVSASGMNAGLGFAVPSKVAKRTVDDLINKGRVERGYLGVIMSNLDKSRNQFSTKDIERGGVYIQELDEEGPAKKAGIEQGDIIISVDDKKIENIFQLRQLIGLAKPNDKINITLVRKDQQLNLDVILGSIADSSRDASTQLATATYSYQKFGLIAKSRTIPIWDWGIGRRQIQGMSIIIVKPGSIAEKNGFEAGDLIVEINGQKVYNQDNLEEILKNADLKNGINFTILDNRGWHRVTVKDDYK